MCICEFSFTLFLDFPFFCFVKHFLPCIIGFFFLLFSESFFFFFFAPPLSCFIALFFSQCFAFLAKVLFFLIFFGFVFLEFFNFCISLFVFCSLFCRVSFVNLFFVKLFSVGF